MSSMTKRRMDTVGSEFGYEFDKAEGEVEEDGKGVIPFLAKAKCRMTFTRSGLSGWPSLVAVVGSSVEGVGVESAEDGADGNVKAPAAGVGAGVGVGVEAFEWDKPVCSQIPGVRLCIIGE
jgi:hypothetical protein